MPVVVQEQQWRIAVVFSQRGGRAAERPIVASAKHGCGPTKEIGRAHV